MGLSPNVMRLLIYRLVCVDKHTKYVDLSSGFEAMTVPLCNDEFKAQIPLDISVSSKPQYDTSISAKTHTAPNTNHPHTPKSRKLALSLAAVGILSSASLDIAAADCRWSQDWSRGDANSNNVGRYSRIDCTGNTDLGIYFNSTAYTRPSYYRETRYYISGTTSSSAVSPVFSASNWQSTGNNATSVNAASTSQLVQEVFFNNFSGGNTTFKFQNDTSNNGANQIGRVGVFVSSSTIGTLDLIGRFSNGVSMTNSTIGSFVTTSPDNSTVLPNVLPNVGVSGSTIGSFNNNSDNAITNLTVTNGSNVGSFSNAGTISSMTVDGGSNISSFNNTGTISSITVGNRNVSNSGFLNNFSSGTITNVTILNTSITIDGTASAWNNGTQAGHHILVGTNTNTPAIADNSIQIQVGDNIEANAEYEFKNFVKKSGGNNGTFTSAGTIKYSNIADTAGLSLKATPNGTGLIISADVATSYGASAYRALVLSTSGSVIPINVILRQNSKIGPKILNNLALLPHIDEGLFDKVIYNKAIEAIPQIKQEIKAFFGV